MRGALVILLLAASASADNDPRREGEYGGVTPGEPAREGTGKPPNAKRPAPRGTLTWIGFEAKDGGAEVFFQSVAPFEVRQRVEGGSLIIHLGLTRLGQNTWRQVDTRFFDSPLSGIVARTVGAARASRRQPARSAGIEARITFKDARDARQATVRTSTEADGMYYAFLSFPQGSAGPAVQAPPEEPAAPKPSEEPAAPKL